MPRNTHRIMATLARLQHEAATGPCGIGKCHHPAVGYVQTIDNRPIGVCAAHRVVAQAHGVTVYETPIRTKGR